MSYPQDCAGCTVGDHSRHDRDHGLRPGLIGGTYCGCSGDCADRSSSVAEFLSTLATAGTRRLFRRSSSPTEGQ